MIRHATNEDFRKFYDRDSPMTMRAWVNEKDGIILAIGGYYLEGNTAVTFTDHKPEMTKRDRVKSGHFLVNKLKQLKMDVVACTEHASVLEHFGFEPMDGFWRLKT